MELNFVIGDLPPYLKLNMLDDGGKNWLNEGLAFMTSQSGFSPAEIKQLKDVLALKQEPISGDNAKEQMLATFYYSAIMKRAQYPATKLFPKALGLIKKSAEAFLSIHPKRFQANLEQTPTDNYQKLLDQKIRDFLLLDTPALKDLDKEEFLFNFLTIKDHVPCAHNDLEMLEIILELLKLDESIPGVIIEAGVFKGGSTVRLSNVCALLGRKLLAFDSFQGLPEHNESSPNMLYPAGTYLGAKEEVLRNLNLYGKPDSVELIEGWFKATLPGLTAEVAMAFLDVDLASSTQECLKYIWPRLVKGGVVFSHDINFVPVDNLLHSQLFWESEFQQSVPKIERFPGSHNLIRITK
jgi:O-methyltransferase